MSASRMPTVAPSCASASARFTAVVDLPTPPLPLATATMFFTPGMSFTPRCTACDTIRVAMSTCTRPAPGIRRTASVTSARSASCWLRAG